MRARAVEGPICGPIRRPDFVIPENSLGTLGILASLLAAFGLVAASNKNQLIKLVR